MVNLNIFTDNVSAVQIILDQRGTFKLVPVVARLVRLVKFDLHFFSASIKLLVKS